MKKIKNVCVDRFVVFFFILLGFFIGFLIVLVRELFIIFILYN